MQVVGLFHAMLDDWRFGKIGIHLENIDDRPRLTFAMVGRELAPWQD